MKKIIFMICLLVLPFDVFAFGIKSECEVTSNVDKKLFYPSFRNRVEYHFNRTRINGKNSCYNKIILTEDITLKSPITIGNDQDASGVTIIGEGRTPRVINVSGLSGCAITIDSDRIKFQNIMIRGSKKGTGLCLKSNENQVADSVFESNGNGITVSGSGNTIETSIFRNNSIGVKLEKANHNELTQNSYYNNATAAYQSPETAITPVIQVVVRSDDGVDARATDDEAFYDVFVLLGEDVDRVEVYNTYPISSDESTYLGSATKFTSLSATIKVPAQAGDTLYAVAFKDGTTSSPSLEVRLDEIGGFGDETGAGASQGRYTGAGYSPYDCDEVIANPDMVLRRSCVPGSGSPSLLDTDCDGIYDNDEAGTNCYWSPSNGGSDPTKYDTDGDGLHDGLEDKNRNGNFDLNVETDPVNPDTDGDYIEDGVEDHNHNGVKGTTESDPTKVDTDGDNIADNLEDINLNGIFDTGETMAYNRDTDLDGVFDGVEDRNRNGDVDFDESDPRKKDSDGDRISDSIDNCPLDSDPLCEEPCIPGVAFPAGRDTDRDGLEDREEAYVQNCAVDVFETDYRKSDTDDDGLIDRFDPCPKNSDVSCVKFCNPGVPVPLLMDSDNDGRTNREEDGNGNCKKDGNETDAFLSDSDADGISDGIEAEVGLDPLKADTDLDGLKDGEEDLNNNGLVELGETNPKLRDTDGDSLNDADDPCPLTPDTADDAETGNFGCQEECNEGVVPPANRDSDNDGLKDVFEQKTYNCFVDVDETNPYNPDTDFDGQRDGIEDKNGNGVVDADETDPRDADSDNDGINDGDEDINKNGRNDYGEMSPLLQDTDSDGIFDQFEDKNKNGRWDAGESSGYLPDSDYDGLTDGDEDLNKNGNVDAGETDSNKSDTDGDGALDNVDQFPTFASSKDLKKVTGNRGDGGCSLNSSATFGFNPLWMLAFIIPLVILRKRKSVTTF